MLLGAGDGRKSALPGWVAVVAAPLRCIADAAPPAIGGSGNDSGAREVPRPGTGTGTGAGANGTTGASDDAPGTGSDMRSLRYVSSVVVPCSLPAAAASLRAAATTDARMPGAPMVSIIAPLVEAGRAEVAVEEAVANAPPPPLPPPLSEGSMALPLATRL